MFQNSPSKGDNFKTPKKVSNLVESPFIGSSSYNNYANYGALPKANIKEQKKFTAGFGDFDGISTYNGTFNGPSADNFYKQQIEEKQRVKEYKLRQNKGSLSSDQPVPFKGVSSAHRDFNQKKAGYVDKVLPYDMVSSETCFYFIQLFVPHGTKMNVKSEAKKEFDAKPIRGCTSKV